MKETMMQYFEWYSRNDGWHWNRLRKDALHLKKLGITYVWMPPAYKGAGGKNDVGYGVYDLYDLGEFDQKGTVRTRYGTKEQYLDAIHALKKRGIKPLGDIVFNHRMGADGCEEILAKTISYEDRTKVLEEEHPAKVWTLYYFPGRHEQYSNFIWNWTCFTGTDYDALSGSHDLLEFHGKEFNPYVSSELGNFDFIMGNDVDTRAPWVVEELIRFGRWYLDQCDLDGFRLDAIKSIDYRFFKPWLSEMKLYKHRDFYAVGEYWSGKTEELTTYLEECGWCMNLFDVPLHYRFYDCSRSNGNYDIRGIFTGTLCDRYPEYAVTFVDNHDTQPTQGLESWVEDWFKTSAYALILLRHLKMPCVFYGDYKGIPKSRKKPVKGLEQMLWIRANLLSDEIIDCNDSDPQKTCWYSAGSSPVVVLISIGDWKERWIQNSQWANQKFIDIMNPDTSIYIDDQGNGKFYCRPGSCSVFLLDKDYEVLKRRIKK